MSNESDAGANLVQFSIMGTPVNLGANLRDEKVEEFRQAIERIETRISEVYYRGGSVDNVTLLDKKARELFAAMLFHYELTLARVEEKLLMAERKANQREEMLTDLLESLEKHLMDQPITE